MMAGRDAAGLSLADIAAVFTEKHGAEFNQPITNRWVGAILRRLGISLYKSNGVFVLSPGQDKRIAALFTRYGVDQKLAE
jgi:transposase